MMLVQCHWNLALPDLHGSGLTASQPMFTQIASTAACKCVAKEQTAEHVITFSPIYHHLNGAHAFSDVNKNLATWLMETCLDI